MIWAFLTAPLPAAEGVFQLQPAFETALRAQSPDGGSFAAPTYVQPAPGGFNPYLQSAPQDPFLYPADPYQPGPPPGNGPLYGTNAPQPYRFGWTPELDWSYLPAANTSPDVGNFSIFELDTQLVFSQPVGPELVFTAAPQFNYRHWDTESTFSRDLYRFGMNLQLATASPGPWNFQLTFNPSLNSDLRGSLASEALNLDVNAAALYQINPQWTAVLGIGYLDRVDNIILPYAGAIYRPDDLWEFRLLFPQGRISRFLGNFWWGSHWLYLNWEYHVESYQFQTATNDHNQIQYQDYRITFGMRSDHPGFTKYIEAGYVFGRDVDYKETLPGFDVSDGFIVRGGIRF